MRAASPRVDRRPSGIAALGDIPWGAHVCQFYRTPADLVDILVPFFQAGLAGNERCLWVTAQPLDAAAARAALRSAMRDYAEYEARGQIQVLDHEEWYLRQGALKGDEVVGGWLEQENAALRAGYEGLRLTGNTSWLEPGDWQSFAEYEACIHAAFHGRRILGLCSYSLDRCSASNLLDVVKNHGRSLIHRDQRWSAIQSATALLVEVGHSQRVASETLHAPGPSSGLSGLSGPSSSDGRHLARLHSVTSALGEATTVADVCRVVRSDMADAVGATGVTIALAGQAGQTGETGETAQTLSVLGLDGAPADRGAETGAADQVLPFDTAYRTGTTMWPVPPSATVVLPLMLGARRCGALAFELAEVREPSTAERALFEDLARQLALALDRARMYELAQQERARAEEANQAKDEFLAMLGHELRNPLSPILTALQLMRLTAGDVALKERQIIERQLRHLLRLVDDLLDISRITRGTLELSQQPLELADVVARAVELASPMLEERRHRFTTSVLDLGIPIDADAHRLAQAVANLLINAAKYTPNGGSIELSAQVADDRVHLRVRDNGIGIEPWLLSRVFEPFVQDRQALDRANGGLGLGLAIVRRLVELHGGAVSATSEGRGRGSTFTIELPLAERARRASGAPPARVAAEGSRAAERKADAAGSVRVLVVDDNVDAAEMLADVLGAAGHVVRVAHDGPAALALADELRPELALLDIGLPVMDGFELAQRLRTHLHASPPMIVAVTGYGQPTARARASEVGFDEHIVKPLDIAHLEALIRRLQHAKL